MAEEKIVPATMTTKGAEARHQGVTAARLQRYCLRGKMLARIYGGASRVPEKEKNAALFAKKVGKEWMIPISELDRVFLGSPSPN